MRLVRIAAPAAVAALAAGGVAVASGGSHAPKTESAAATFTAAPTAKSKTRTCTGADGTYNVTRGVYTGTSTGDPRLTGDIVIRTKTLVNQDSGLGTTRGIVTLKRDGHRAAVAGLQAVNTERGHLEGFLAGKARDTTRGATGLYANFSAAFNGDGTELSGELGGDSAAQNTAVFQRGGCDSGRRKHGHRHHH